MQVLKGHNSIKPVRSLAFAPDGNHLASSARDYKTFLWDLSTGTYEVIEASNSYTVAFSPDGRIVATGQSCNVMLYDRQMRAGRLLAREWDRGHGVDVVFTPDGKQVVTLSGTLRVHDFATLKEAHAFTGHDHLAATNAVALTRDGKVLATGHDWRTKVVRLWDTSTWAVLHELDGPTATVDALAFSPSGRHLAAAAGMTLWVWDVPSREAVVRHKFDSQNCKDVAFSPDGRLLAFARNDATVRMWDTADWKEVAAYDWKVGPMITVAFAPDGMRAAAGSGKGKIVVWDVDY